ncbi:hypothetical protein HJC23_001024 [Cyclotella cryptica]|uniref:FH2 domain-containing protein n=1 Tax=Cyclotella cryptica TaxID=29204 RepID=A0ABD3P3P9_9STRA|eukprot:CCRYP_018016-RA/>CCRYP_018016-RA protein AED:0.03 eAED:0.03 QI:384/1/1/1/0.71/0.5/8/1624/1911
MKKATKKLFKSPPSRGAGINGHSLLSAPAASALSLSPVAENDDEHDFHRNFYEGQISAGLAINDVFHEEDKDGGTTTTDNPVAGKGEAPRHRGRSRPRHPHEVDREVDADDLRLGVRSSSESRRRRRLEQQQEQLDKWAVYKERQQQIPPPPPRREKAMAQRPNSFNEAYKDYDRSREKELEKERRRNTSAPPLPFSHGDVKDREKYLDRKSSSNSELDSSEEASSFAASSKQKRVIDNYVQRVIANSANDDYVTPLPRMDSSSSNVDFDLANEEECGGELSRSSHSAESNDSSHNIGNNSLLPLPGFGEVDLLQRAIERRALLHDRIVKMEAASAELVREDQEWALRKQEIRDEQLLKVSRSRHQGKYHNNLDSSSAAGSENNEESAGERPNRRASVEETNERMDLISERIKQEALEFLNFESSYVPRDEDETNSSNLTDEEGEASNGTRDPSDDDAGMDPPGHDQQQEMSMDQAPTQHQLTRYSNMVRLGIPDLAVLRSMERDGIEPSQVKRILESLKNKQAVDSESLRDETVDKGEISSNPKREIWRKDEGETTIPNPLSSYGIGSNQRKDSLPPLKDDPNYSKYFKMLKAKVPLSWVKRVLQVDGKDARVLDLDPDRPLAEQIAGAGVDADGNVDWTNVVVFRTDSDKSMESGDEIMRKVDKQNTTSPFSSVSGSSDIRLETTASVKAELAIMSAKAGRISRDTNNIGRSDSLYDAKERKPSSVDISSAAAAASNARLDRLKAMRVGEDNPTTPVGRRKQSVDEIRRRPPPPPPRTPKQIPLSPSGSSVASGERTVATRRQNYDHLPLKDDPRFAKYFQMIRSRVPRSWVERVIEVDDRDPAILDLDPNKPLAAQVEDEDSKSLIRTVASEPDVSLDESARSGALDVSRSSDIYHAKHDSALSLTEEVSETQEDAVDDDSFADKPPITQIVNTVHDDDRSIASSITNFKDNATVNGEQSNIVLDRISAFLDKIESRAKDAEATAKTEDSSEIKTSLRFCSPEDIENKLATLIERFDSKGIQPPKEPQDGTKFDHDERQKFVEDNYSDITKLSALLAAKLGKQSDASKASGSDQASSTDQTDLAKLSSLLTEVLSKIDEQSSGNQESSDPAQNMLPPGRPSKNAALEALFAKRAALSEEKEAPILREDPEYQKYFKMQKLGLPRPTIVQALERDGKDASILDLDPEKPLAEQKGKKPNKNTALEALFASRAAALKPKENDVPLKNDPEYQKYFKMLKVGMPRDAVEQALERDGKSASVLDLDPEKSYASQMMKDSLDESRDEVEEKNPDPPIKDDPEYAKFFKMLKMGIPLGAVEQALQKEGKDKSIASMDPEKSYSSQIQNKAPNKADVPLKDDPEYAKFFKMQRMGIPIPAVRQALQKEGKDPNIIDMDPEKPYASQIKDKAPNMADVPLKDDPEYAKFFKMQRMGIPVPAVKQALQKEGKDPNIIEMDPEKPLSQQQNKAGQNTQKATPANAPKVARKRLHWNKIDESKLNEKSFWNKAKEEHASLQLVGLDIDNEEFASLFTSPVNKSAAPKKDNAPDVKKPSGKQKVQLIDGRRRMNGSILLTKFKVDYKLLAKQVDRMEYVEAEGNELRGMMQLLPTKDESLALRSYLPPADAPQAEIDEAIDKLGECEQYMAVMLDVPDAKEKFQCMLFRAEFDQQVDSIREGTKLLIDACDSVQNSERFKKLLMYALKLGNALNTGGSGEEVTAITLDSLLKLAEAKAFDRQTSVLHYLVSIVSKNDEDVLRLSEDFGPVKAAERVAVDMLSQQLKELSNGIKLVKKMAKKYSPNQDLADEETNDATPEDELLSATPMGKFSLSAESLITSLTNEFDGAKNSFADLLEFFGEDASLTPEAFFCTINTFVSMFDQTYKDLNRKEEAKERKKRIEEKRKLREEAASKSKAEA